MTKVRVFRKQNRYYIELPENFNIEEEMELFELRNGYYLLTRILEKKSESIDSRQQSEPKQQAMQIDITEPEKSVLKKLMSVRFQQRTPPYVQKILTPDEMAVLDELKKRKLLTVYVSKKYSDGVYNIADSVYPMLKNTGEEKKEARQDGDIFQGRGYLIVNDNAEAKRLSERLKTEMKTGDVMGIKSFDGHFYVVKKEYYERTSAKILGVLTERMNSETIAKKCELEPEGCKAVLQLLSENGDVIEQKKGMYLAV